MEAGRIIRTLIIVQVRDESGWTNVVKELLSK